MGLSFSLLSGACCIYECLSKVYGLAETKVANSISFGEKDDKITLRSFSFRRSDSTKNMMYNAHKSLVLEKTLSFKCFESEATKLDATVPLAKQVVNDSNLHLIKSTNKLVIPQPKVPRCPTELSSPTPNCELHAAAITLQRFYKSYRTRRNLADCAVVVEELWWKALDFASLERSSISFFKVEKQETAISRWARAATRAAKVGKGLSKDEKAQKLALQHWLEAIDPRHRYGHNLHFYYDVWFQSESTQPFFYWLDAGDGREINLDKCSRSRLQKQCITYLGPKEREAYEVTVKNGKLIYKHSEIPICTTEGSKWIFVLSTSRVLYVGQKKKGTFQHSSFLAGGAATAAGRLVATDGVLEAIWPYSGHYLPTEENFKEFIIFLQDNNVDLSNVKTCSVDDDECSSFKKRTNEIEDEDEAKKAAAPKHVSTVEAAEFIQTSQNSCKEDNPKDIGLGNTVASEFGNHLPRKWTTANGARIGCVRDYPADLQLRALEQVNLSPRVTPSPSGSKVPIPSPRPSPNLRLSPRIQYMRIPSPRVSLTLPEHRRLGDDVSRTDQYKYQQGKLTSQNAFGQLTEVKVT